MKWVRFTKRTEDPKLAWIECQLLMRGIPSRRSGYSFHGPILEVPEQYEDAAWAFLGEKLPRQRKSIDDMDDDHPIFQSMQGCDPAIAERLRVAGREFEAEHMEDLAERIGGKEPGLAHRLRKEARPGQGMEKITGRLASKDGRDVITWTCEKGKDGWYLTSDLSCGRASFPFEHNFATNEGPYKSAADCFLGGMNSCDWFYDNYPGNRGGPSQKSWDALYKTVDELRREGR